jgi:predicted ATPase with chaperone activity
MAVESIPDILNPPVTAAELDIPMLLVEQLMLRRVFAIEQTNTHQMVIDLGLDIAIIDTAFESLRGKKQVNVLGLQGNNYRFELTQQGRERATEAMNRTTYAGVAPVSLPRYFNLVNLLRADMHLQKEHVAHALSDLVVSDDLIRRVGPAFATQRPLLLHGPSGTGKTSIAERLVRLYDDAVAIPYAVEVDGQIIVLFDPIVHRPLAHQPEGLDPRWVVCERPMVIAGGELELSMLDVKRDPLSGIYMAPLQMKANNGILIVDDFGRQQIAPSALLNRWIVPLERRIDYLTLDYGLKFTIPFECLVVFSTNIPPLELGDEAFFRRIPNKIHVGEVTADEFDEIVRRAVDITGFHRHADIPSTMRMVCAEMGATSLRPCIPIDLCRIARSIVDFDQMTNDLSRDVIWRSAEMYFTATGTKGATTTLFGGVPA